MPKGPHSTLRTRLNRGTRSWHRWAAIFVLAPAAVIFTSGIILHFKKVVPWIQPTEHRGTGAEPRISLDQLLAAAATAPDAGIAGWADVNRIDFRPGRGVAKVQAKSGWEVQVDMGTGDVLQSAYRRSDLIESIHDGRFFGGDVVAWGVFTPAGVLLLVLTVTGAYLWFLPIVTKRRSRIGAARARIDAGR